jgi:hypothetical protein
MKRNFFRNETKKNQVPRNETNKFEKRNDTKNKLRQIHPTISRLQMSKKINKQFTKIGKFMFLSDKYVFEQFFKFLKS